MSGIYGRLEDIRSRLNEEQTIGRVVYDTIKNIKQKVKLLETITPNPGTREDVQVMDKKSQ